MFTYDIYIGNKEGEAVMWPLLLDFIQNANTQTEHALKVKKMIQKEIRVKEEV
jgi:hypothetical protein